MLMVTGVSATMVGMVWHRALVHGSRAGGRGCVGHSSSGLRQTAAGPRSLAHSSEKYRSSASQVPPPKSSTAPNWGTSVQKGNLREAFQIQTMAETIILLHIVCNHFLPTNTVTMPTSGCFPDSSPPCPCLTPTTTP